MVDFTEAVEAAQMACEDAYEMWRCQAEEEPYPEMLARMGRVAVTAAAPLIEAQVREMVAREIEAEGKFVSWTGHEYAFSEAARIARGRE